MIWMARVTINHEARLHWDDSSTDLGYLCRQDTLTDSPKLLPH
jgi:hypothetical protein